MTINGTTTRATRNENNDSTFAVARLPVCARLPVIRLRGNWRLRWHVESAMERLREKVLVKRKPLVMIMSKTDRETYREIAQEAWERAILSDSDKTGIDHIVDAIEKATTGLLEQLARERSATGVASRIERLWLEERAAVAAEREKFDERSIEFATERKQRERLEQQLAAERKERALIVTSVAQQILELRQQLAAEREKLLQHVEANSDLNKQVLHLSRDLAAERENRETVEKLMIETANAVEKQVAEGRKPLVEALETYIKAMDAIYNHNAATRAVVVKYFGTVHPKAARDALAKVKE